jgi:hypothetical protein
MNIKVQLLSILLFLLISMVHGQDIGIIDQQCMDDIYPYSVNESKQITDSLASSSDFQFRNIYYGNNKYYIPCISINVKKNPDTTIIKKIQQKICGFFPVKSVTIHTMLMVKGKPYVIISSYVKQKLIQKTNIYYVDSIKKKTSFILNEIKNIQPISPIRDHKIVGCYVGLGNCISYSSFSSLYIITTDSYGNYFQAYYHSAYFSQPSIYPSIIKDLIPLKKSNSIFISQNDKTLCLYYITNTGNLVVKELSYVKEYQERYSEYLLKVF